MQIEHLTWMKLVITGLLLVLLGTTNSIVAQKRVDETVAEYLLDSLINKRKSTVPLKATLLSAILPGAGQVYNQQYYKLHIVYAAIGGMIYAVDWNSRQFNRFDDAYKTRLRGENTDDMGFPSFIPTASIGNQRQQFRKDKEMAYFGLGLVYLLNVADAFVSSHLTTFNIEDDLLSARLKLSDIHTTSGLPFPAIGLSIEF